MSKMERKENVKKETTNEQPKEKKERKPRAEIVKMDKPQRQARKAFYAALTPAIAALQEATDLIKDQDHPKLKLETEKMNKRIKVLQVMADKNDPAKAAEREQEKTKGKLTKAVGKIKALAVSMGISEDELRKMLKEAKVEEETKSE